VPPSDPIDPPGARLPEPYAQGVQAIYAYQASHRGEGFDAIWQEIGEDTLLVHDGIVFIPQRGGEMYMPEAGTSTKSGCLILLGALVAIAFVVAQFLPDSWSNAFFGAGPIVWIAVGAAVLGIVAFALVRADKERRENVKLGIWPYGVFLFPNALILRTDVKNYVFEKKDIVRFAYRVVPKHQQVFETCLVRLDEYGTEVFHRVIFLHDSTKVLEEWRQRPSEVEEAATGAG
jgi:hypothetical protein